MYLNNSQYQQILRLYDEKQARQKHLLDLRRQEVEKACPAYARLGDEITRLWASSARAAARAGASSSDRTAMQVSELEKQQIQLLTEAGYPPDYLELKYDCPLCRDTGFIGDEKCRCFTAQAVRMVNQSSHLTDLTQDESFDTFRPDYYSDRVDPALGISPRANAQSVAAACRQFVREFGEKGGNLLLYGDTGVGKTFLIHCIAKELLDQSYTCICLTAPSLVKALERSTFRREQEQEEYEPDPAAWLAGCDLLIIDDLGSELNNAFVNSQLFNCIEERLTAGRSTLISTNLRPEDLQSTYSERISSRLLGSYRPLFLFGDDIRLLKQRLSLSV